MAAPNKIENCKYMGGIDKCDQCHKDYALPDDASKTCVKVATPIANCEYYEEAARCAICSKGFRWDNPNKVCAEETTFIGCTNKTGTLCEECRFLQGWWATDYELAKGNICTYASNWLQSQILLILWAFLIAN